MVLSETQKMARRDFVKVYGKQTRDVVSYIARGWNSKRIATKFNVSTKTVAAYRANVTRGAYQPFIESIDGQVVGGVCNW